MKFISSVSFQASQLRKGRHQGAYLVFFGFEAPKSTQLYGKWTFSLSTKEGHCMVNICWHQFGLGCWHSNRREHCRATYPGLEGACIKVLIVLLGRFSITMHLFFPMCTFTSRKCRCLATNGFGSRQQTGILMWTLSKQSLRGQRSPAET